MRTCFKQRYSSSTHALVSYLISVPYIGFRELNNVWDSINKIQQDSVTLIVILVVSGVYIKFHTFVYSLDYMKEDYILHS